MLHERWHSAFFELIVGRTLQVLAATIEVEPGGASDTRVDFVARFPDATVAVEAVSPIFGSDVGETIKRRNPLLDIVESVSPPDVWVLVSSLPDLGPQDSKKRFRSTVRRLLAEARDVTSSPVDVVEKLPEGTVRLRLAKKGAAVPPGRLVGIEPALTTWDDIERRVRRAIARKRRQGRAASVPALVAVHSTGIASSYEEVYVASRMLRGRNWAGITLATGLGVLGTLSIVISPVSWLAAGHSVGEFLAGADPMLLLFASSRVVHLIAVFAALVLMFRPAANDYFRAARSARRSRTA